MNTSLSHLSHGLFLLLSASVAACGSDGTDPLPESGLMPPPAGGDMNGDGDDDMNGGEVPDAVECGNMKGMTIPAPGPLEFEVDTFSDPPYLGMTSAGVPTENGVATHYLFIESEENPSLPDGIVPGTYTIEGKDASPVLNDDETTECKTCLFVDMDTFEGGAWHAISGTITIEEADLNEGGSVRISVSDVTIAGIDFLATPKVLFPDCTATLADFTIDGVSAAL